MQVASYLDSRRLEVVASDALFAALIFQSAQRKVRSWGCLAEIVLDWACYRADLPICSWCNAPCCIVFPFFYFG
jgi:hypothetical protein